MAEQVGRDRPVGPAGRRNVAVQLLDAERLFERPLHGDLPRAAGEQERSINIEQDDVFHGTGIVATPPDSRTRWSACWRRGFRRRALPVQSPESASFLLLKALRPPSTAAG